MPLSYSFELVGQVVSWLKEDNYTPELVSKIGQDGNLRKFRDVLEGKAEIVMKKVEETVMKTVTSILNFVKTITTLAIAGEKTNKCFTSKSRYYYRDTDIDAWLPKEQSAQAESTFAVQELVAPSTFKQIVEKFLRITGDIATLAKVLKERGCITTLPTVESLIERQEAGEDVGLWTNGYGNFFFVEDNDGGVSVVYVGRRGGQWRAGVRGLGSGSGWDAEHRFFFRNSDTGSL